MSYYEDGNDSSDSDNDPIKNLGIEDFVKHPETAGVLEDEFFENFKEDLEKRIEEFYCEEVDYVTTNYLDVFDKDFEKKNSYDFFLTIYNLITKDYDISIFQKFPNLARPLWVKNKDKTEKKQSVPTTFDSKKFDWNAKKI